MNRLFIGALLVVAVEANAEQFSVNIPALQDEGKAVIGSLVHRLTGKLEQAKEEGGAVAAINVCNLNAFELTEEVSKQQGWVIKRTSLKLRNPENAPDNWEQQVLEQFVAKADVGANLKTLKFSQVIVEEDGRKVFRMMKAIPVSQQCLACHGAEVQPELKDRIGTLYPSDQAQGFSEGQLRGAFSLKKYL